MTDVVQRIPPRSHSLVHSAKRRALAFSLLLVLGALSLGVVSYNVAATQPHSVPIEWLFRQVMRVSIRTHARSVSLPPDVQMQDRALAERAIGHYSVACELCHAAPGASAAPWIFLYPAPPKLTDAENVARWSDAELYWIIKNGIKDTGMIALGPTHADRDLWAVSAFVRQLPSMSEERYRALRDAYRQGQAAAHPAHQH